jgi:hypothetical protein
MKMRIALVILLFRIAVGQSQTPDPPVGLSDLTQGLANPNLVDVPELTGVVKARGVKFDLTANELASLLAAATKGNRDPAEVSALILACMEICQECRARTLAPMTKQELIGLLHRGFSSAAVLREVRVRGVSDIAISKASAEELRGVGAQEDLVGFLIPEDRIPVSLPEGGFKAFPLKRAEQYNAAAPEGWLKITAELSPSSQNEFVFKHNALFARATKGEDPADQGSEFNKPAPANLAVGMVEWDTTLEEVDQNHVVRGVAKVKPAIEFLPATEDPDGRNAFRIQIVNREKKAQRYSFWLRWRVRAAAGSGTGGRQ